MSLPPATVQAAWCDLLIGALAGAGLRDLVISPGSRSTPLLLAALRRDGLALHVVPDERSAGFFALGQAKLTGRPSALVCTSGSAPAHYLPAVLEASYGRTPLVVLSADRPPELQERGAAQTVDQARLFGVHVRRFVHLGVPEATDAALRGAARAVARACAEACDPVPGPVHVNVPLRKPLEPGPADPDLDGRVRRLLREQRPEVHPATAQPPAAALDRVAGRLARAERGLVVAGPGGIDQRAWREATAALCRRTGFPLLAEAGSQLLLDGGAGPALPVLGAFVGPDSLPAALRPDLVLQLGRAPVARGLGALLASDPHIERIVLASPGDWPDPSGRADHLLLAHPAAALTGLLARVPDAPRAAWRGHWEQAAGALGRAVDDALDAEAGLTEPAAARGLVERLPAGTVLVLGNSLPVRLVDQVARPARGADLAVITQRGTAGIDGLVSLAAGAAAVSSHPLALLVGDVAFLHDLPGLAATRAARVPLVVVVLDNGGGRLFEQLPVAHHPALSRADFERFFLTPTGVDAVAAAGAFGLPAERVGDVARLGDGVDAALARNGASVVVAEVAGARTAALAATFEAQAARKLAG